MERENVFKNAEFGDLYRTLAGDKAVFIRYDEKKDVYLLRVENDCMEELFYDDGNPISYDFESHQIRIMGRWKQTDAIHSQEVKSILEKVEIFLRTHLPRVIEGYKKDGKEYDVLNEDMREELRDYLDMQFKD